MFLKKAVNIKLKKEEKLTMKHHLQEFKQFKIPVTNFTDIKGNQSFKLCAKRLREVLPIVISFRNIEILIQQQLYSYTKMREHKIYYVICVRFSYMEIT